MALASALTWEVSRILRRSCKVGCGLALLEVNTRVRRE